MLTINFVRADMISVSKKCNSESDVCHYIHNLNNIKLLKHSEIKSSVMFNNNEIIG
jgi:hypothetical protein